MKRRHIVIYALSLGLFGLGVYVNAADVALFRSAGKYPVPAKSTRQAQKNSSVADEKKKPFADEKPFAEVIKDMEVSRGLFTFYRKPEENKIYWEIAPEQFEQTFLFSGTIEESIGERGLYSSQMGGHFPFQFRLVGKTVQWIILNSTFTAEPGTPAERTTARSFSHSIAGSARIVSQPHPERKSLLINAADLLLADIPGLASALKEIYRPSDYRFDRGYSAITGVKTFPENALFDVTLHFASDNPRVRSLALPDERSIPIVLKYDFSRLRNTAYRPRLADDRVGHFLSLQQDFTSDRPGTPYVRRIHRWKLEKKDPTATLSEPREPITFWIENTVPKEYRQWMADGALLWNRAFEQVGFKDAIVVRQQPDDALWDAADSRYNTIRWFAGVDAAFAIGPSRANPYTGEIYDADIGFSEGIIRSVRRNGEEFIAPILPSDGASLMPPRLAWHRDGGNFCHLADGLAQQAAFGVSVLAARGQFTPEMEDRMMREYIVHVTAHEVGHTLGLRHNFRASTLLDPNDLLNDDLTAESGQSGSVMDYNPIVLAGRGEHQGHFVPTTLGPYDYWAIEYAYRPFPAETEMQELKKIASRAADPRLAYSTDEDALGTFSATAVDPLANQFDQSSDPLRYFEKRIAIIVELWNCMESRLVREGEGYQVLRRAMQRSLGEYHRGLLTASKFVGGLYHYRDHAGDANGRPPFEPIPAAKQRRALEFMRRYAFSEQAFRLSPDLYNKLAPERLPGLDGLDGLFNAARVDTPWHESVLNLQRAVLQRLHAPATLARLEDNDLRFEPGDERFTMADMFAGLRESIWSELQNEQVEVISLRRNLQREHLKTLQRLALRSQAGIPEDATSLARLSLGDLLRKTGAALNEKRVGDISTQAHLEETHARIKAALEAQIAKRID